MLGQYTESGSVVMLNMNALLWKICIVVKKQNKQKNHYINTFSILCNSVISFLLISGLQINDTI